MYLLSRQLICDRLRLQKRTSYRIVGTSRMALVSSDEVLSLLNCSRQGIKKPLIDIPSDLRTPEEMAEEITGLTEEMLLNWVHRRTKNVPPHFKFNSHTIRFSAHLLKEWLEERSKVCKRRIA